MTASDFPRWTKATEQFPLADGEKELPPLRLGEKFDHALAFASALHRKQARKGTRVPYLSHLLAVAALVLEDGGSEDEAIAALLHDAVEDGGGRAVLDEIRDAFGEDVADIVAGCSDTDEDPKPPWKARKEAYIAHLDEALPWVVRVSLADKLHNARALTRDLRIHGEDVWRRFKPDSDQLWYYRTLVTKFHEHSDSPMVTELEREVDELETLAVVSALRRLEEFRAAKDYAYHHVIIRGDDSRNYYIQFAVDRGGLFCEAVHNMYLKDEDKLTSDQVGELLARGWQPPDHPNQNLYRTFQPSDDLDLRAIATLSRRALTEVYGVPEGRPLGLTTSWRSTDGIIHDAPFDFVEYLEGVDIVAVKREPRPIALFVAGGPLSGSAGVLKQLIDTGDPFVAADAVVIDPTLIRQKLPEWGKLYEDRDPGTTEFVRAETIDIARSIVITACDEGRSMIMLGIGAGEDGEFGALLQRFADSGYEVRVLLADAPVELELERNEMRASKTGLRFDPELVEQLSIAAARQFTAWSKLPWVRFQVYSTGQHPA